MKIIFFVENNHAGGMDSFFANTLNNWPYLEDELVLICNVDHPGLPNIKTSAQNKCTFIDHNILISTNLAKKLFFWLPFSFRRILKPFLRVFLMPYQLKKLKNIFSTIDGDRLLVVNGAYPGGETCRLANIAWTAVKKNQSVHNIRNFAAHPRLGFNWYENWIDRKLDKCVHSYVGVSQCCAESLRVRKTFKKSNKIFHIYNGVESPDNKERERSPVNLRKKLKIGQSPLCLMLATYEIRKGYSFLFDVFDEINDKYPDAHLVVCGDSTTQEKKLIEKLRISLAPKANIHLLDFIPDGKKLINQADILLVASQEWESFGWTVIEAMVRGIPVVSTNAGGLAEVVGPDGVAGFSVERTDTSRFFSSIEELLLDPERRRIMGEEGKKRVAKMFTVQRMVLQYADFIRRINL